MSRLFVMLALAVALVGCQANTAFQPSNAYEMLGRSNDAAPRPNDSNCGSKQEPPMRDKGGKLALPVVPSSGNFGGYFGYTALSKNPGVITDVESCSYNSFNIPVPPGYSADWFGWWDVCNGQCAFSFGAGDVTMQMQSSTWIPKQSYYLYIYATNSGELIALYPVGMVKKKKERLTFASPFENGFAWPTNDTVSLEIVHPAH